MKKTWDEDWIDEEDLVEEQTKNYFQQQRSLRSIPEIDKDLLEEDLLEEESAEEFWFARGEEEVYDHFSEEVD